MKKKLQFLRLVFWLLAAADIVSILLGNTIVHYISKPLLLPALMALLITATAKVPGKTIMLAALFFSWLGDVFLLFENQNSIFFIAGLGSFLTTHVLYSSYFLTVRNNAPSLVKKQPAVATAVILYGAGLVGLLFHHLGELKIPVVIYATVICTMLLCSLHILYKLKKAAAVSFVLGAAFFVISDSLLAINKFYAPFTMAGAAIMLTYCAAQYFIVTGFIKHHTHEQSGTAGRTQ